MVLEIAGRAAKISTPITSQTQVREDRLHQLGGSDMNTLSVSSRNPQALSNGHAQPDAASPFTVFHREMDQLLSDAFGGFGFTRSRSTVPTVEVQEAEKEYLVTVDLPGVELKDIDLSFNEGMLTLKAERRVAAGGALYSDRWSGGFERVIGIGSDIDPSRIGATLKNGVLAVTLPKSPDRLPRRIEIQ
jgi:HSP20 family protein